MSHPCSSALSVLGSVALAIRRSVSRTSLVQVRELFPGLCDGGRCNRARLGSSSTALPAHPEKEQHENHSAEKGWKFPAAILHSWFDINQTGPFLCRPSPAGYLLFSTTDVAESIWPAQTHSKYTVVYLACGTSLSIFDKRLRFPIWVHFLTFVLASTGLPMLRSDPRIYEETLSANSLRGRAGPCLAFA